MRRAVVSAVIVLAITVTVALTAGLGDASRPAPAEHHVVAASPDPVAQLSQAEALAGYLQALGRAQVGEYLAAVAHEQLVAFIASIPAPAPPSSQVTQSVSPQVSADSTGACGGATNGADQFIMRESGGNPNAYNPSGAWGCYQIMPGTWAGAGCDDLGSHGSASPAAQAACASRLSLSAWNL